MNAGKLRNWLLMALLAGFSMGAYLLACKFTYHLGFPLDDAWIHQTYARNLALYREWSFILGQPSAGSTSPLWTFILALGYLLSINPYLWTYFTGGILLTVLALLGKEAFAALAPQRSKFAWWAGVLIILEWHLVWSSGSGMETMLYSVLVFLVLTLLVRGAQNWVLVGVVIGVSVWTRPDGITLLAPAGLALLLIEPTWVRRFQAIWKIGLGFTLFFIPYLIFNQWTGGSWWPNTYYAKQAEYGILQQQPIWSRFLKLAQAPLTGVGGVLIPGAVLLVWQKANKASWTHLLGLLWAVFYLGLYAWRLPVSYQHGRYLIPMMPVFFIWGFAGLMNWIQTNAVSLLKRVISKAWLVSLGTLLLLYWAMGARAYAGDVAFIESEMVATAQWVADNTDQNTLIAAHDIGALGFFGERQILDMAGLVSPEVIPFIRDEALLRTWLDRRGANYLVTFPGWYPVLVKDAQLVYRTNSPVAPGLGGENMAVYLWRGLAP
jgi:hypothetical protein